MDFDGRDEREPEGPECQFMKLMPGPWQPANRRRYEAWRWRHQDREFATGEGEPVWRERQEFAITFEDVVDEHVRAFDAAMREYRHTFDAKPRLIKR